MLRPSTSPQIILNYCRSHQLRRRFQPPQRGHQDGGVILQVCTTDDFATSFPHFSLLSNALWELAKSRPVYALMLSSHLFLCLPCILPPFTVPCKMVLPRPGILVRNLLLTNVNAMT